MGSLPIQPSIRDCLRFYSRTGRRAIRVYGPRPCHVVGRLNPRPIFVVGCPRSGTTFIAAALGSVTGFADLGEVGRLKAGIPGLYEAVADGQSVRVVKVVKTILSLSQRAAMAAPLRSIEQTPESTFLIPQLATAFPGGHFIHLLRDGRDVVSSLVERGWLAGRGAGLVNARAGGEAFDEVGHPFGGYARFWVEPGRSAEFEAASEARRCAWAWRRYVTTARSSLSPLADANVTTIRYEEMVKEPAVVAERLAVALGANDSIEQLAHALSGAHARSVGKHVDTLSGTALADVVEEAGVLLAELGYVPTAGTG